MRRRYDFDRVNPLVALGMGLPAVPALPEPEAVRAPDDGFWLLHELFPLPALEEVPGARVRVVDAPWRSLRGEGGSRVTLMYSEGEPALATEIIGQGAQATVFADRSSPGVKRCFKQIRKPPRERMAAMRVSSEVSFALLSAAAVALAGSSSSGGVASATTPPVALAAGHTATMSSFSVSSSSSFAGGQDSKTPRSTTTPTTRTAASATTSATAPTTGASPSFSSAPPFPSSLPVVHVHAYRGELRLSMTRLHASLATVVHSTYFHLLPPSITDSAMRRAASAGGTPRVATPLASAGQFRRTLFPGGGHVGTADRSAHDNIGPDPHGMYPANATTFCGPNDPAAMKDALAITAAATHAAWMASRDRAQSSDEILAGRRTQRWMRSGRSWIPEQYVWHIAADLVLALVHLHDRMGLVHCDLKLDNILIDRDLKRVVLVDYGCALPLVRREELAPAQSTATAAPTASAAAAAAAAPTRRAWGAKPVPLWQRQREAVTPALPVRTLSCDDESDFAGTGLYRPPESYNAVNFLAQQSAGTPLLTWSDKNDIWALGITLFQLLTGADGRSLGADRAGASSTDDNDAHWMSAVSLETAFLRKSEHGGATSTKADPFHGGRSAGMGAGSFSSLGLGRCNDSVGAGVKSSRDGPGFGADRAVDAKRLLRRLTSAADVWEATLYSEEIIEFIRVCLLPVAERPSASDLMTWFRLDLKRNEEQFAAYFRDLDAQLQQLQKSQDLLSCSNGFPKRSTGHLGRWGEGSSRSLFATASQVTTPLPESARSHQGRSAAKTPPPTGAASAVAAAVATAVC